MNDKEALSIIMNKTQVSNKTLDSLLYTLCDAGDNEDTNSLMNYIHIGTDGYDHKICDIFNYICSLVDYSIDVFDCRNITNDDIRNQVGVLPTFALVDFIEGCEFNYFIIVDYEAPDKVYTCDYLLDLLEDTCLKRIINHELEQKDIDDVIAFINDLDLFDTVLYEEYNGEKVI